MEGDGKLRCQSSHRNCKERREEMDPQYTSEQRNNAFATLW